MRQPGYVHWWLLNLLLVTCVPFTTIVVPFATIVVGRFAHFAPAIWRHAGHMALISGVGLRLVLITPHLELGDHLRHRQLSAIMLMGSSRPAIALSFVDPRLALWALALNFAGPLLRRQGHRAAVLD